ncbi:hypothetical protein [Corticimicrobacter populi]|uniref:hypothetical protein n=1 Tax=Corticimicrobacter populi TaxID=2175229 RepID=UPI00195AB7F1|nr:hypothetical protein [Corticimicrobacter populi]
MMQFHEVSQWQKFLRDLDLDVRVPAVVRLKYARAQKLYLLGWSDAELIKAGELVALTALEIALVGSHGGRVAKNKRTLAALLKHLVEYDGLSDDNLPIAVRCNACVVGQLTGESEPTLAQLRNKMAHGDPFDGLPYAGLLELVRDLINFAYRGLITEHRLGDNM